MMTSAAHLCYSIHERKHRRASGTRSRGRRPARRARGRRHLMTASERTTTELLNMPDATPAEVAASLVEWARKMGFEARVEPDGNVLVYLTGRRVSVMEVSLATYLREDVLRWDERGVLVLVGED